MRPILRNKDLAISPGGGGGGNFESWGGTKAEPYTDDLGDGGGGSFEGHGGISNK